MLNYHALKAADAALGPSNNNPTKAASALNAQTITLPSQDFSALDAFSILLINGDWPRIVVRSETRPIDTGGPISAAISAIALLQSRGTIHATNPAVWTMLQAMLAALVQAGDIGAGSQSAILALRTPTAAAWPVPLTEDDIVAARSSA